MSDHGAFGQDPFGRAAEKAARFFGTPKYIIGQTVAVVLWITLNSVALIQHWDRLSEWPQMLLRAVLHRLALHAQHPDGSAESLAGLERAAGLVSTLL